MSEFNEVLERLAGIEAKQETQLSETTKLRGDVADLSTEMTKVSTKVEAMPPRCDSHSTRLRQIEDKVAKQDDHPRRINNLESAVGRQVGLAGVISAVTAGSILGLKWLTTMGK